MEQEYLKFLQFEKEELLKLKSAALEIQSWITKPIITKPKAKVLTLY